MNYTEAKSCPLCENNEAILNSHRCQDYYDSMQKFSIFSTSETYQPTTLAGKLEQLVTLKEIEDSENETVSMKEVLQQILEELKEIKEKL
jgi:hypothetical protein